MGSRLRAPTRSSLRPEGRLSISAAPSRDASNERLPPCQIRRCRRRFRTTTTGRTRTPSIGSTRTLRPERAQPRLLFTYMASLRTLSLAASLGRPRQRPAGRLELPRAPETALRRPALACESARKMRLTDFCNRLPSRAPCGLPDSRSRRPALLHRSAACADGRRSRTLVRGLTLGLSRAAARFGTLAGRVPDEPSRWSFA